MVLHRSWRAGRRLGPAWQWTKQGDREKYTA